MTIKVKDNSSRFIAYFNKLSKLVIIDLDNDIPF
jgi:hypothetical protein